MLFAGGHGIVTSQGIEPVVGEPVLILPFRYTLGRHCPCQVHQRESDDGADSFCRFCSFSPNNGLIERQIVPLLKIPKME